MASYPWKGNAQKIDDYDLPRIGHMIGVGEDEIHAVLDVESRGTGFDKYGVIKLFEKHVFYRNLPKNKREEAVRRGLATKSWKRDYANNHETFLRAYAYDKTAALKACSWGLGQTLGENHIACGFNTPLQMVKAYADDEAAQLEGMINFIVHNNLDDELRDHDWAGFARGYNGKYYYKHNYHGRLKKRFEWWQTKPDTPWSPEMAAEEEREAEINIPVPLPKPPSAPEEVIVNSGVSVPASAILAAVAAAVGAFWETIYEAIKGVL